MMQIYSSAAVLFVLVLLAGIMMIASSLNSNVAQRTEFFWNDALYRRDTQAGDAIRPQGSPWLV